MAKSNKQAQADFKARKKALKLVRKDLWHHPLDWDEIKAFADAKTDRRRLIDECKEK